MCLKKLIMEYSYLCNKIWIPQMQMFRTMISNNNDFVYNNTKL